MANADQLVMLKRSIHEWNTWREANPNIIPDLSDADLSQLNSIYVYSSEPDEDLEMADLRELALLIPTLSKANLSNAILTGASLVNSDLNNADLSNSDLTDAKLIGVNLYSANLKHIELIRASFTDSYLQNTDFTNALFQETTFSNVDLSKAIGLETVYHHGPSYIDIHTLYKSQGNIPEVFLRGCGVPEDFINNQLPLFIDNPIQFHSCFISYSHQDKEFAQKLYDALQKRGIRCWKDDSHMKTGERITEVLANAIHNADYFILCSSKNSLTSWWVNSELNVLFAKEREINKKTGKIVDLLITCDLDQYFESDECEIDKKARIEAGVVAKFKGWKRNNARFEAQIERIIKALRTDGGKQPPPKSQL